MHTPWHCHCSFKLKHHRLELQVLATRHVHPLRSVKLGRTCVLTLMRKLG